MIEILPAILPESFEDLVGHLLRVRGAARLIQIDVIDGAFAPHRTWPYADSVSFENITSQEEGMPFWEEFDFEFDVMALHPERDVENLILAGATRIVLHAKSPGILPALELLQKSRGGELGIKVGIALELSDEVSALEAFDGLYDYVQVMGIAKVGFQGEAFDERALPLVRALCAAHPSLAIQVDGGVRHANARALVAAGATSLVVGSAVFATEDPEEALETLYTEVDVE